MKIDKTMGFRNLKYFYRVLSAEYQLKASERFHFLTKIFSSMKFGKINEKDHNLGKLVQF